MNQKNSLNINICFGEQKNPIDLFKEWYEEAKKSEINDPNAVAVATSDNNSIPSVRMVLLKDFSESGFIFYTNLDSKKSEDLKSNPNASMCFHWKSLFFLINLSFQFFKLQPNIPSWVTAPTTLYFLPNLILNTFFAIAPAATLDAVSRADCLPPPL